MTGHHQPMPRPRRRRQPSGQGPGMRATRTPGGFRGNPAALLAMLIVTALLLESWGLAFPAADATSLEGPWEEGPVDEEARIPVGDDARRIRVPLTVSVPEEFGRMQDVPVTSTLDVADVLAAGGWPMDSSGAPQGFVLDLDSVVLHEVGPDGASLTGRIPLQVFPGSLDDSRSFDARTDPRVTLRWVMEGETEPGQDRHYRVYFDSLTRGSRIPATYSEAQQATLSATAGPGPGTQTYVPFYPLARAQGESEPRKARIVNLVDGPNEVRVHEYTQFGFPETRSSQEFSLEGLGDAAVYTFGRDRGQDGNRVSHGKLSIRSDAPVFAEVFRNEPTSVFIPAIRGGLTGEHFVHNPHIDGALYVMCHALPCQLTIQRDGREESRSLSGNQFSTSIDVQKDEPVKIETDRRAAVQFIAEQRSPVAWPSLGQHGPVDRSQMMGYAGPEDGLMVLREEQNARLFLQQVGHGNPRFTSESGVRLQTSHLQQGTPALFPLGSAWNQWDGGPSPASVVRAVETGGTGGLHVVSGPAGSGAGGGGFSAFVTPETHDGGLTYTAYLPGEDRSFGSLFVFTPYPGTRVTADRQSGTGSTTSESFGPLSRHQFVELDDPGFWTIRGDRPILVAWLHRSTEGGLGGLAMGVTEVADVIPGPAEFTGPVFDLRPVNPVVQARDGQLVEFQIDVRNLGRTVDGDGIEDVAELSARAPSGWSAQVVPSNVELPPDASETVTVTTRIPTGTDPATGGATIRLDAKSRADPSYTAEVTLRVNFIIHRDVEVRIDGHPVESERQILFGEVATYVVNVTNTGSLPDRFRLAVSSATGSWERTFTDASGQQQDPESTPLLEPGESADYILEVEMATEGASRLITQVQAVSQSDRAARDTARAVTSFAADRSFRVFVEDPSRLVLPGETTVFNVTVENEADVNEEIEIETFGIVPPGWPGPSIEWAGVGDLERVNHTIRMDPGETVRLDVARHVPEEAMQGELAMDRLRLRSTFVAADDPGIDVLLRTTADRLRGFSAIMEPPTVSTSPGSTARVDLQFESHGNTIQEVSLEPVSPEHGLWRYVDDDDNPPPWRLSLAPGQVIEERVHIHVPVDARPATEGVVPLRFHATIPGVNEPKIISGGLEVAERFAARIEGDILYAHPGRATTNTLSVQNDGNVDLVLEPRGTTLPQGWTVDAQPTTVPVGESVQFTFRLTTPTGEREGTRTIGLEWVDRGGRSVDTRDWNVEVGTPVLHVRVDEVHQAGGSLIIPVWIANDGRVSAFNVTATLYSGEQVVDRQVLDQILPGKQSVAPLAAPRDAEDLNIRVTADHDLQGIEVNPEGALEEFLFSERALPFPLFVFVFALMGVLAALSRSRRSWT